MNWQALFDIVAATWVGVATWELIFRRPRRRTRANEGLVEALGRLAARASEQPWNSNGGAIVTQGHSINSSANDPDTRRYYGGGLIAESIARGDREFICALVNAWPEIRAALVSK